MVQLSVTPVYYPEYRGLLVHLSYELLFNLHLVLEVIYQQLEVQMTSCERCFLFTFVKEN